MRARPLYDIVALLARIGIGTVFIAHGWQKVQVGVTTTSDQFTAWDVPFPTAAAVYATFVELLGGAALILGLGLPVAGVLLFIDMAGAIAFVNGTNGIFLVDENGVARNGFELSLVLGLAALVFAAGGAGRLTLDSRLFARRSAATSDTVPRHAAGSASQGEPGSIAESSGSSAPATPASSTTTASSSASASSASSLSSAGRGVTGPATPAKPGAPAKPAMPATTGGPTVAESAASPRLAADIVTGTSRDTLVAGRKKRRSGGKKDSRDETRPLSKRSGAAEDDPSD
ncbi:MAG TPA: DoxX family protein [Streptosporangiaceae bacterium]|nr:DoxX family protein [Streptosporangiaceae bacterium]